jgi:hypothetical protein
MATRAGIPCPDCKGNEKTVYQALVADKEGRRYAVGPKCYRKQWAKKYGKDVKCPV